MLLDVPTTSLEENVYNRVREFTRRNQYSLACYYLNSSTLHVFKKYICDWTWVVHSSSQHQSKSFDTTFWKVSRQSASTPLDKRDEDLLPDSAIRPKLQLRRLANNTTKRIQKLLRSGMIMLFSHFIWSFNLEIYVRKSVFLIAWNSTSFEADSKTSYCVWKPGSWLSIEPMNMFIYVSDQISLIAHS